MKKDYTVQAKDIIAFLPKQKEIDNPSSSETHDVWGYWIKPDENQVDKAFKEGTKLIGNLLSEGQIDSKTATSLINQFVEMYVGFKFEKMLHKFINKCEHKSIVNLLRDYMELEKYG
ncbi:hypothetical protein D1BOALGB6SA_10657 [Olavius sp. associated proteobacterium Delta 1]|nr:hypothetical protein D1BOALGB6SA_10657 [Olavius sp. associated proteobacterium Delta 1]